MSWRECFAWVIAGRKLKIGEALLSKIIGRRWSIGPVIRIDRYDLRLPWKGYKDLTIDCIIGPHELLGKQYNKNIK